MFKKYLAPKRQEASSGLAASVLVQWWVAVVGLVVVLLWQWPVVEGIYFGDHPSSVGRVINGLIVAFWVVSMLGVLQRLIHYRGEEITLNGFAHHLQSVKKISSNPPPNSLIGQRYAALLTLSDHTRAADQGALAAAVVASESARNGFLRFVYNVLILTGVLGTIVALSIALLGVSDLFDINSQTQGLNSVLFGMSTALSTTMTAIIAYLLFGYFYIRLQDVQSRLLARLEETTATLLIPKLGLDEKTEARNYAEISQALRKLIEDSAGTQANHAEAAVKLQSALAELGQQATQANERYAELLSRMATLSEQQQAYQTTQAAQTAAIAQLLREGFRLDIK